MHIRDLRPSKVKWPGRYPYFFSIIYNLIKKDIKIQNKKLKCDMTMQWGYQQKISGTLIGQPSYFFPFWVSKFIQHRTKLQVSFSSRSSRCIHYLKILRTFLLSKVDIQNDDLKVIILKLKMKQYSTLIKIFLRV